MSKSAENSKLEALREALKGKQKEKAVDNFAQRMNSALIAELFKPQGVDMKIESEYIDRLGRIFAWLDRGERMAAEDYLPHKPKGKVREITGRASRKEKIEAEGPLDNPHSTLHIFTFKRDIGGVDLECFYWQLRHGNSRTGNYANSIEEAAECAVKHWYKATTAVKFVRARAPQGHHRVVLLGSWITNDEYQAYKRKDLLTVIPDANSDDRTEERMFVLGYPSNKSKVVLKARNISRLKGTVPENVDPQNYALTLESGLKIESSLDWYLFKPEDRVQGEVQCCNCEIVGDKAMMDMLWVRGTGPVCGPCRDDLFDKNKLDDALFDQELGNYTQTNS